MAIDERTVDKLIEDVDSNTKEIALLKRDVTKLETLFQGLKDLPEAIHKLDKTLVSFEGKIDLMNTRICNLSDENKKQNDILKEATNKGNINLIDWVTKNFWKLIGIICAGGYILHDVILKAKG